MIYINDIAHINSTLLPFFNSFYQSFVFPHKFVHMQMVFLLFFAYLDKQLDNNCSRFSLPSGLIFITIQALNEEIIPFIPSIARGWVSILTSVLNILEIDALETTKDSSAWGTRRHPERGTRRGSPPWNDKRVRVHPSGRDLRSRNSVPKKKITISSSTLRPMSFVFLFYLISKDDSRFGQSLGEGNAVRVRRCEVS